MSIRHNDVQVLVVGAGPTGLVLACELLARGVRTRVIDKGDGVVLQTRALAVHARALEVFDMMGLAGRFLAAGQVVRRFRLYADGNALVNLELAGNGSRFGFMLDVPQDVTETILRRRIGDLGGRVEQRAELRGLRQDAGGVTAAVTGPGGAERTVTADYLVGADGAHSRVRAALGLGFDGHPYTQDWLLADVRLAWHRRDDEVHAFFRRDGRPLICMPMRGHLWRVILPYAGDRGRLAPTLEEIQRLVAERAPEPVPVSDPAWLATFRCGRRSTDVYRRGRVMLAGDAVHIHSPAGGQGMNTGIMDAHNLGWKLALVTSGRAPDALLDSYGPERGPVAADVLALTHALVRLGTMTRPVPRALRKAVVPLAGRVPPIQRRAVRRMGQLQVAYPASPLTRPGRGRAGLRPGDRAPDLDVDDRGGPSRLHEVLRRGQHVLLISGAGAGLPPELRPWQREVAVVTAAAGRTARPAPGPDGCVCLVRPDGYVAARGSVTDPGDVLGYLRETFPAAGPDSGASVRSPAAPAGQGSRS